LAAIDASVTNLDPTDREAGPTFPELQARLAGLFGAPEGAGPAPPRTVVVMPSLSMEPEVLARISGVHHYEERMLCMLLLLREPRTRVVYVTSRPIPESIVDYYLHLLQGIPAQHARARLTLLSCHDGSPLALSAKVLARPRLVQRIRDAVPDPSSAYLTCFNVTEIERDLALRLRLPVYGCDPALLPLGSKSGSRQVFREAGIPMPDGFEDLEDAGDVAEALAALKNRDPNLRKAVVKLNEGFSGEGNAVFRFEGAPEGAALKPWIRERLPDLAFEAKDMTWELYEGLLTGMGGIAEAFIEGEDKRSPSAQFEVDPRGGLHAVSTHDQVLGGDTGQIFLGCRFPADAAYRLEIQEAGMRAARILARRGVLGRFAIDFLSVRVGDGWRHHAIEINLRKGGTTHPFLMLQFLTDGRYDPGTGEFRTPTGQPCCYYASDNLEAAGYQGLTPADLIDIAAVNGLHYHGACQEGVAFHLIGALSEFGKLGVTCIGSTHERAEALYRRTVSILDREGEAGRE
jgi:hypothetical protein